MSKPIDYPTLTPQFCFNQTVLRDFLRLSRSTLDDTISQNLNSLLTPSSSPFDPSSTSSRTIRAPNSRSIAPSSCTQWRNQVLFPTWQSRSDILTYCASVATSPDPSDPDELLKQVEDLHARERVVDERLDPYSARYFPRESRTESLATLLRNERSVERIIRERTWAIVREKCGDQAQEGWERALGEWRKNQNPGQ